MTPSSTRIRSGACKDRVFAEGGDGPNGVVVKEGDGAREVEL